MRTSESISDIAGALAKAQGAFENPARNREVEVRSDKGTYTFKYATIDAIVDCVRKPLSENGLAFTQAVQADEQGWLLTTRLLHSSGQWMEFDTPVFVAKPGAQAFGSGITYARRYALTAMLCIVADEDDDGNTSEGNHVDMRSRTTGAPKPPARPASTAPQAPRQNGNGKISSASNDEAAETFTTQSIEAIGKMRHQEELSAWWRTNSRHIEKLEAKYPALFDRLTVAADEQRDRLPHVTAAA